MKKNITKIAALSLVALGLTLSAQAQWTRNTVSGFIYPTAINDKIGIGTNTPSYQLDIKQPGVCSFRIQSQTTGSSNLILSRSAAAGQNCLVNYKTGNIDLWRTGCSGNDDFSINNAVGTSNLYISQATGFVGIGTTAPTAKLNVVGDIKVAGNLQVTNNSSFGASMNVSGNITSTGQVAANTLNVTGNSNFGGSVFIGNSTFSDDAFGNLLLHANLIPDNPGSHALGSTSNRWTTLFADAGDFSSNLAVSGSATVGGTLAVTSSATVGGTLGVTGTTTMAGGAIVNGVSGLTVSSNINVSTGNITSGADLYTGSSDGVINCGGGVMNAIINIIGDADNHSVINGDEDLYIQGDMEVGGSAFKPGGGSWTTISDARLKHDVKEYNEGLAQIMKIHTVKFKYNDKVKLINQDKEYVGVLAQELKEVAPYMVNETTMFEKSHEGDNGEVVVDMPGEKYFTVDNSAMTYMLVNAVKELNANAERKDNTIASLMDENSVLKQRIDDMESCMSKLCNAADKAGLETETNKSSIMQNQPNPFNKSTVINYNLMSSDANAKIIIRDLSGNLVKQVNLAKSGKGQVTINANELAQGTYTYTLEVNGTSVDTKLMVLVK